jgi:isoleucyl-tRNA synthetase
MGLISKEIQGLSKEDINQLDKEGSLTIVIAGNNVTLTLEDVEISSQDIEGLLVANSNGITVALDITISPELKQEGIARELVNRIQNLRKDSGFEVTDKIKVYLQNNATLEAAVKVNEEYIKSETLTEALVFQETIADGIEIEFDEIKTRITITK